MQKSLKRLCLPNNEIALPDCQEKDCTALISTGRAGAEGLFFFPHRCFFGSSVRRRKQFYLIPLCTEQREDCVPGNTLSRFGSLRHKAAELSPLLNAPLGTEQEFTAAPSERPAGLILLTWPGRCTHLSPSDSRFPPQVTAKAAAPCTLGIDFSRDQTEKGIHRARGELSWRQHLSVQVGWERREGKGERGKERGERILPYFGNTTSPELLQIVFDE